MKTCLKLIKTAIAAFLIIQTSSCMMMMHGPYLPDGYNNHYPAQNIAKDPVCGAEINKDSAMQYTFQDRIYYFDSEECLKVFQKNPERFIYRSKFNHLAVPLTLAGAMVMGGMMIIMMSFWARGW